MKTISIAGRTIGGEAPAFVVAEISANHRQSLSLAKELIHAAKEAGADAVKTQTFTPDTITFASAKGAFLIKDGSPWAGKTLHELYQEASLPWNWHEELKALAGSLNLTFLSTAFDATAVDFLEKLGVPAYKIASFELVDIPLIKTAAATGKPLVISTGMATKEEIAEAVGAARGAGCKELALLKCVSGYPAKPEEMNLRSIHDLAARFDAVAGLSDHSLDTMLPSFAVSAGASIIEKHITMRRADGGLDAGFSLEPSEFKLMVWNIRSAEKALGRVSYATTEGEGASKPFRRSLYAVADIAQGEPFTAQNIRSIRPGDGLHTRHYEKLLHLKAKAKIEAGTPLRPELVEGFEEEGGK